MDFRRLKARRLEAVVRSSLCSILLLGSWLLAARTASALGTPVLVEDINPGSESGAPRSLLALGGQLFFASTDGASGMEPWASDATAAGTNLLVDIWPGANGGYFGGGCSTCNAVRIGPVAYFSAFTGAGPARLWRTDGTTAGTASVFTEATAFELENVGGTLFFAGTPTGFSSAYLHRSDGTSGGTVQVTDLVVVGGELTDVDGTLYFSGYRGGVGTELWKSDGTAGGTSLVKDLTPGSFDSVLQFLTNVGGNLFFKGTTSSGNGIFVSDGTDGGTHMLKALTMEPTNAVPGQIVDANGTAFLIGSDGVSGMELWRSDGTFAGTVLVKDINPGSGDGLSGSSLLAIGSTVYFAAGDGTHGRELWKSDGTEAGTVMVKDIFPGFGNFGSSSPAGLANVNGTLFFRAASSNSSGTQPWRSNGTDAGTVQMGVVNPTPGASSQAEGFTAVGNHVFFSATDGSSGLELWVMSDALVGVSSGDGSTAGAVTLSQNYPNPVRAATEISYAIPAANRVLLELYDVSGREVRTLVDEWQSAGAHRVEMSALDLPSGAYFYRLQAGSAVQRKKLVLVR